MAWIETAPKQWASGVHVVCGVDTAQEAEALWTAAQTAPPTVGVPEYVAAIDAHIERVAQEKAYSGAVGLASYVGSTVPQWQAEAQVFVAWRDAVWSYAYAQFALVQSGQRTAPTIDELIAELPVIAWPS